MSRHLDLMVDLLLVRRLEPWYGNVKKRLVKSPRTYVRDSGVVHTLLQIPNYEALLGHPIFGKSWEGFVIETIINRLPASVHPFFYRTSAGAEIDLVIEFGLNTYWAIEIKASRTPSPKKGFHIACADLKVEQKLIVHMGEDHSPSAMIQPCYRWHISWKNYRKNWRRVVTASMRTIIFNDKRWALSHQFYGVKE